MGKKWWLFSLCSGMLGAPIIGKWLFPNFTNFFVYLATYVCIMVILSIALHIFFGICGQINFGVNGFYAAGAYLCALLITKLDFHYFIALPLSVVACGIITLLLGFALLRLRHWVLALGTAAFGFAVFLMLRTVWVGVLGGDDGILVPGLNIFGKRVGLYFYYYFVFAWLGLCSMGAYFLEKSRAGRAMRAIQEDEIGASAIGINVGHYVRVAFLVSGVYMGLAGALFAQWNRGVAPDNFGLHIAMLILVYVVVGGVGKLSGAIIGTTVMVLLPEIMSFLREYQSLVYAFIFFMVMRFMPRGIVGTIGEFWSKGVQSTNSLSKLKKESPL